MSEALATLARELRDLPLPWEDAAFADGVERIATFSHFGLEILRRYPDQIFERWACGAFSTPAPPAIRLPEDGDEAPLMRALRCARHVGMLEVLWRDVMAISTVEETIAEVTILADTIVGTALGEARRPLARFGTPRTAAGQELDLIVFGLGKLGGFELNFSSDIDLVFAFAEAGSTDGKRSIENEDYFRRLGTQLTRLLGHPTADGICYRVDLRLRPYGSAGRTALSARAMEHYFEREGRSWERYAWIKARPIAGDIAGGNAILEALRPFVYRRYLDYSAFDALRNMKAMIRAEVERKALTDHVKLGRGGIREIEFFAQAFQLIRGGREPALRTRSLIKALAAVEALGEIDAATRASLTEAYRFLRRLENRFQQVADEQTHRPPDDPALRDAIARSLDGADWATLEARWNAHRDIVASCFEAVFAPEGDAPAPETDRWALAWQSGSLPEAWEKPVASFRAAGSIRMLATRARQRLDRLMPRLFEAIDNLPPALQDRALERCLGVIEAIARRSTYLAMMTEQPEVLNHVVALCATSRWVTETLARHPLMLDELIDRSTRETDQDARDHLAHRLASADGDLELEMEILREVRDSRAIQLAATLLAQQGNAEQISGDLADTADALLDAVYGLAWRDLARRHGTPPGEAGGLALIGYGTLGGRELSFDSDLDLVFLYGDGARADAMTDGDRPIATSVFFTRLCQRILHLLTTQTASGKLFEVDTRLRPNGRSGLLVSSFASFRDYQEEKAWTWETQALSRARCVAGDPTLASDFEALRRDVLMRPRNPEALARDVVEMRGKMRGALDASDATGFDLKQGPGGRVDLEFLTQFGRLRWAATYPALISTTGTLDGLRALTEAGLLSETIGQALQSAFLAYRRQALENALEDGGSRVAADRFVDERTAVRDAWTQWLGAQESGEHATTGDPP